MSELTFAQAVRDVLDLDVDGTSKYTDQTINSNIRLAGSFLERATKRVLRDTHATRKFTSNGSPYVTIPGLRVATSITKSGSALTADESYYLSPDVMDTGVYVGVQFQGFNQRVDGPGYQHYSDWFDTNKDTAWRRGYNVSSMPNDVVIEGDWGYTDAQVEALGISTVAAHLAAFYTKYPDAILAGGIQTANDGSVDLSGLPVTVQAFVASWALSGGVAGA